MKIKIIMMCLCLALCYVSHSYTTATTSDYSPPLDEIVQTVPDAAKATVTVYRSDYDQAVPIVKVQSPIDVIDDIKQAEDFDALINLQTALMAFLVLIGGYLSPFIPFLRSIPSTTYRVLTFAVVVAIGAVMFGFADIWQGALAYFFSTSMYELVFSKLAKTVKPTA